MLILGLKAKFLGLGVGMSGLGLECSGLGINHMAIHRGIKIMQLRKCIEFEHFSCRVLVYRYHHYNVTAVSRNDIDVENDIENSFFSGLNVAWAFT